MRFALIFALLACTATADESPRVRDGRAARRGRGVLASGSSCAAATGSALVSGDWVTQFTSGRPTSQTPNYAAGGVSPGCAADYDRFTFNATVAATYSFVTNLALPISTNSNVSYGCHFKTTAGDSESFDFCTNDALFGVQCHTVTATGADALLKVENQPYHTGSNQVFFGNDTADSGRVGSAVDVLVWGCRFVVGATLPP
jgi:hypothetical protein